MIPYRWLWPFLRRLPAETAHHLSHLGLALPVAWGGPRVADPFTWRGLKFPNRIGIAAGYDKDAACVPGLMRLGAGFVEVGTILTEPWTGNPAPRLGRIIDQRAVWNRLGFPSRGVDEAVRNLAVFAPKNRAGMLVACNIGPHSGKLKNYPVPETAIPFVRDELRTLVARLHPYADFFVVNLSSPNTPGLRGLLVRPEAPRELAVPTCALLRELDAKAGRAQPTPLLWKLPPEDSDRVPWNEARLAAFLGPFLESGACDGVVAVNTSTALSLALGAPAATPDSPGGISGAPLLDRALATVAMARRLLGPDRLLIGCGGVVEPKDATAHLGAGADVVEVYSGLIYSGPKLISECAKAMAAAPARGDGS